MAAGDSKIMSSYKMPEGTKGTQLVTRFHRLRKNSMLHLILGGAALQRCNNRLVLNAGFSR
jgi:hypothetical protein